MADSRSFRNKTRSLQNIAYRQRLWDSAEFFKFPEVESRNSVVIHEPDRLKAPSLSSRTEQLG